MSTFYLGARFAGGEAVLVEGHDLTDAIVRFEGALNKFLEHIGDEPRTFEEVNLPGVIEFLVVEAELDTFDICATDNKDEWDGFTDGIKHSDGRVRIWS